MIEDKFTHILSKERRYALRHPDKVKQTQRRYDQSLKGKARRKRYYEQTKANQEKL